MPQLNTAADIAAYIQTIYEDAMFVAREQNIIAGLVTTYSDRTGLASRSASEWSQATINTIGESDDLTSQAFNPSVISTLTPAERGAQFFLTDSRLESDPFEVQREAALELGAAMATKIETDVIGNFSSLTGGTVGAAGSTFTWSYLASAVAVLRNRKVPGPYYAVLHPYHALDLGIAVANMAQSTGQMQTPSAGDGYLGGGNLGAPLGLAGMFQSANISVDSSDDAVSAVFNPMALALDSRRAPRLEPERDASRRGWELNMTAVYAHGVWRPTYGVKITADATTPS